MKYKTQEIKVPELIKKIFFVGIKGVGMAPLAIIAKEGGFDIAGSDTGEEFITDLWLNKKDVKIFEGFETHAIQEFFGESAKTMCLVITTGAHKGFDNPQVIWAKEKNIPVLTQGQALSIFMDGEIFQKRFKGIAIAGSHGKTTISSLLATTLMSLDLDPSYSVGTGEVFPSAAPGHFGNGEYFIAEADEYASEPVYDRVPKFLYLNPKYAIFNNIDFDHPDLFLDINEIVDAFLELAENVTSGGTLFINGDDTYLSRFKDKVNKDIRIVTYGEKGQNDYIISKIVSFGLSTRFTVHKKNNEFGVFELTVPGIHNAKNSLSVIAFLSEIGYEYVQIRDALKTFKGTKRRTEIVGNTKGGALLIDDYGHHPLEILTTISSIKKSYPDKKLVCVFQPHTFSRTKSLLSEFSKSFSGVHKLILLPVFKSARDSENDSISKEELTDSFSKYCDVSYEEKFSDVIEYLDQNFASNEFVILTIGAGDVYKIGYSLVNSKK